jgi:hypothetical protein
MTLEPSTYNGDFACADGLSVVARDLGVAILTTFAANCNMNSGGRNVVGWIVAVWTQEWFGRMR